MSLPVGFFQFDNLIRNRVPFVLIRTAVEIEAAYGVMEKMHLRNISVVMEPLNLEKAEEALKERFARLIDPVVVLDENGEHSKKLAQELTDKGYTNVYFIPGGWASFQEEMRVE